MTCKIFFYSDKKEWNFIVKNLDEYKKTHKIFTTNNVLKTLLENNDYICKNIDDEFPIGGLQTYEISKKAQNELKRYQENIKDLTFYGYEIFDGISLYLLEELLFIEKAKGSIKNEKNIIFIFENYSFSYFNLLKETQKIENESEESNQKIYYIHKGRKQEFLLIDNIRKLENKSKINFLKNWYLKEMLNRKNILNIFQIFYESKKLIKTLFNIKKSIKMDEDYLGEKMEEVKKKICNNYKNTKINCFFLACPRNDLLKSVIPIFQILKTRKRKFLIFTADLLTSHFLTQKKIEHQSLFEEIYPVMNIIKNQVEIKKFKDSLKKISVDNNLSLIFYDRFSERIIDEIIKTTSMMMIIDTIVKNLKITSNILFIDGVMFTNCAASISKKNQIQTVSIQTVLVGNNPILSDLYKADKICLYGKHGYDTLKNLGFSSEKLVVTGNPRYDNIEKVNTNNKSAKSTRVQKIILLALSRWNKDDHIWISRFVKFCDSQKIKTIIKIHPMYKWQNKEDSKNHIKIIKDNCKDMNYLILYDNDISILIEEADVVITDYSNVGIEAVLNNKTLIIVDFWNQMKNDVPKYHKHDIAVLIEKYEELEREIIRMCTHNIDLGNNNSSNLFIELYNHNNDGKASQRICDLITGETNVYPK